MESSRPLLVLLTETFPYSGPDDPFLPQEVEFLAKNFDILLVPVVGPSDREPAHQLPEHVTLHERLATSTESGRFRTIRTALSVGRSDGVPTSVRLSAANRFVLARRRLRAESLRAWTRGTLLPELIDRPCVVYSWWGFAPAFGVAQGLEGSGIPMVVRVHGYDLFPDQDRLGFIPFQEALLGRVDAMYSVSSAGADYLRSAYPHLADRVFVAHLGVDGPEELTRPSVDGVFRVVTCSSVVKVKRLDRMVGAIALLRTAGVPVQWTHIGDGPLMDDLRRHTEDLGDSVNLLGQVPHEQVIPWLTSNPIDLFCNVSDSEGLPVSLMEAAACGIPLLARDVGGSREIVDDSVGCLLPGTSEATDIAGAMRALIGRSDMDRSSLRKASRARWAEAFQAQANYEAFSEMLMTRIRGR